MGHNFPVHAHLKLNEYFKCCPKIILFHVTNICFLMVWVVDGDNSPDLHMQRKYNSTFWFHVDFKWPLCIGLVLLKLMCTHVFACLWSPCTHLIFPAQELRVRSTLRWTRCCRRGSPADWSRRRWRCCRSDSSSCRRRLRRTGRAENRACTAEIWSTAEPQSSASRSCGPSATGRNTLANYTPRALRIPAQTEVQTCYNTNWDL